MRRADRLFEIVQYLRGRRLTTAAQLAQWLGLTVDPPREGEHTVRAWKRLEAARNSGKPSRAR